MSSVQQALEYRREMDENQKQVREMVMESLRVKPLEGLNCGG